MSITLLGISLDAHNPSQLAEFWAQALHRTVADSATEQFASIPTDDDPAHGPLLMFHHVPEGKNVKNRVHLDLKADDVHAEADRLISLGATQTRTLGENNDRWISFTDPEGNEFDPLCTILVRSATLGLSSVKFDEGRYSMTVTG